jgi:regulatory protein YycH of two-component signal transduction system YycFG
LSDEEIVQLSELEVEMKEMHIEKEKSIDEKIEPMNMFIEDDIPQIPF